MEISKSIWKEIYPDNALNDGIKWLCDETLCGDDVEDILKESSGARVGVGCWEKDILLIVKTSIFIFQKFDNLKRKK